jgi:drug/metabolite transporter (DMT)-like permease
VDQLSRSQRMVIAMIGIVLAVVFAILIVYFTAFASRHPRVKHDVLFIVLTLGSLLVAWFAWPSTSSPREG